MQAASVRIQWGEASAPDRVTVDPAAAVREVLSIPKAQLDYAGAKLALDRLIDPSIDTHATMVTLDRMVVTVRRLAGPSTSSGAMLKALRTSVYEPGPWNDDRPFAYDQDDPLGQRVSNKLLATYLTTRRGNCVSMPILYLILADRLGIDMALASAPLHIFLRYQREDRQVFNLEPTSGAHPARLEWYRRNMPMTDHAIASGLYMRSLSKPEGVALMATTVMDHLMEKGRFDQALRVSEAILHHAPRDGYTMVKQASACGELIRAEFNEKYRTPDLIPLHLRSRYLMLVQRNRAGFETAEALGWEPTA